MRPTSRQFQWTIATPGIGPPSEVRATRTGGPTSTWQCLAAKRRDPRRSPHQQQPGLVSRGRPDGRVVVSDVPSPLLVPLTERVK